MSTDSTVERRGRGRPRKGEKPVAMIQRSVRMPGEVWEKVDAIRGKSSRGAFLEAAVRVYLEQLASGD